MHNLSLRYKQFYKIKQLVSNKGDSIYTADMSIFKTYYKLEKTFI